MSAKRILIVDDDPDVRLGMHVRLKACGYDTFFASDALSGVAEAGKQNPDLIVLDLGLPSGDGFAVLDRLKRDPALAAIPVIVVSARDVQANQDRVINAGASRFLQKPVSNALFLAAIRQELGEPALAEDTGTFRLL